MPLVTSSLERSDRRFGNTVVAPSPVDPHQAIRYCVDPLTIRLLLSSGDVDRFAEYEGLVHGDIPGGTAGLMASSTLFRGLQRPMTAAGNDEGILIYVMNPLNTYRYPVRHRVGMDGPTKEDAPRESVFVAYVDDSPPAAQRAAEIVRVSSYEGVAPVGLVYDWEWVLRSSNDGTFPDNYETRYLERVW